jgi:ABC-2 type transport system ATP-binding protein
VLADPAAALRSAAALRDVHALEAGVDGSALELTVDDGPRSLVAVLRTLDAAGLEPAGVTVREPSLDDVFLTLTGHRAAPDVPAPAGGAPALTARRGAA